MTKYIKLVICLLTLSTSTYAQDVQWADYVISFSSELSPSMYSATQALGNPNVPENEGDSPNAWGAKKDNRSEYIIVGFDDPQRIQQVVIHESFNPGAITKIYTIDEGDNAVEIYNAEPQALPKTSRILNVVIPMTEYKVKGVEVHVEGEAVPGLNCIDAIGISDSNRPVQIQIPIVSNANTELEVTKLGENINSGFDEAGPVVSPDGKYLFFSRYGHPENVGGENDSDDIWYSEWDESTESWGPAKNIGAPLNTKGSNFVNATYDEGDKLVLVLANEYKKNGKKLRPGVSITSQENGEWTMPETLDIQDFYNFSPTLDCILSPDGKVLIMSIEREDTKGLNDLYVSFKSDTSSTWSAPLNLGEQINTAHDETSPLLLKDNKTLFFSSAGFEGYGGSDIVVSTRLDDTWTNWSRPENMGPGVNSRADELQFSLNESTRMGFFVRSSEEEMNIYSFDSDDLFLPPKTSIKVLITTVDAQSKDPVKAILNIEKGTGRATYEPFWTSDSVSNIEKEMDLGSNFKVIARANGYLSETVIVDIPSDENTEDRSISISLQPEPAPEVAEAIEVNDINFAFDSFNVTAASANYIKSIIEQFKNSQLSIVELSGHTDNTGVEAYNLVLSEKRARAVAKLFTDQGISEEKLQLKWFGESLPAYPNDTRANRSKNRRVEIRIVK